MSKLETKKIAEAPGYLISSKGIVTSEKTGKPISEAKGSVRLIVDGERKTFSVKKLVQQYFPNSKEAQSNEEKPGKDKNTSSENETPSEAPTNKEKQKKPNYENKELEESCLKAAGLTSGAALIRQEYLKDEKGFNAEEFSKATGIKLSRIVGCLKNYKKSSKSKKK